ncbi:ImmA/IrrE family metallo-endopeptidase [Virgibacillus oceani]
MQYVNTSLEDSVQKIYQKIGVRDPDHPMEDTADRIGVYISHWKLPFLIPGNIVLDPMLSKEKKKEVFGHELCHHLCHVGVQLDMPESFRMLQEYQAKNFALHFCVPTFMLHRLSFPKHRNESIGKIAATFGVTGNFAAERLRHYEKQINGFMVYEKVSRQLIH